MPYHDHSLQVDPRYSAIPLSEHPVIQWSGRTTLSLPGHLANSLLQITLARQAPHATSEQEQLMYLLARQLLEWETYPRRRIGRPSTAADIRQLVPPRRAGMPAAFRMCFECVSPRPAFQTFTGLAERFPGRGPGRCGPRSGRWPVLLGLVNAAIHDRVADGPARDRPHAGWPSGWPETGRRRWTSPTSRPVTAPSRRRWR